MRHYIAVYIESDQDEDTVVDAVDKALTGAGLNVAELCVPYIGDITLDD